MGDHFLEVSFGDLKLFDEQSAMKLKNNPMRFHAALEMAAREVAFMLTSSEKTENIKDEDMQDIQVHVNYNDTSIPIRKLKVGSS